MEMENKDEVIGKDAARRLVLGCKTPLEQVTELTRIVYKVGRKVLPEYLNEWYQEGVFDFLSCLLSISKDDLSQDVFFRVFDIERNYLGTTANCRKRRSIDLRFLRYEGLTAVA